MTENLSVILAFGAGLLAFFSPCVLPLIPSWLGIIGGSPIVGLSAAGDAGRPKPVARTVSFIFGFSVVFIVLSIVFAATFNMMGAAFRYINIIAGSIVIILGLNTLFNFLSFLNFEKRFNLKQKPRGIAGAFLAGGAFGAGWTPCIGPILAGILVLAAQNGGIGQAVLYLSFFSAGLGLPFLLASFCYNAFLKFSVRLRSHLLLIQRVSGILLVVLGILIATGLYQTLSAMASQWRPFSGRTSSIDSANPSEQNLGYEIINVQANINRRPSEEVVRAFRDARIFVLAESIDIVDFTLPMIDGTEFTLSDHQGKVVFLNFWTTWCGACRAQKPSLEALYERFRGRELEIIAVNIRESRSDVTAYMRQNNLNFPVALDLRGAVGAMYGVRGLPTTYIIDRRGLIVARHLGFMDWNTPSVTTALETLLAE